MKPLLYSEYRIQQGLWLQQEDCKRNNYGTNSEQFYLCCYMDYLKICKHIYLIPKINKFTGMLNSRNETGWNNFYRSGVSENITEIIDNIIKKHLK